jgi:hypothetical protein
MSNVNVSVPLITTRPVEKYGGVQIALEALEQMRDQISVGGMPMHMNHRASEALDATIINVRIEQVADDEHALMVDCEMDEAAWQEREAHWRTEGVPGGFSAALTQHQEEFDGRPGVPLVTFSSDAGAYSDEERTEAAELFAAAAPVEVLRLFQFSEPEFAKIALEFSREVGASLLAAGIGFLVGRRKGSSHVEFRRTEPDGTVTTAVLDTSDPEIVRAAAQSLDSLQAPSIPEILIYSNETGHWEPAARD